MSEKTSLKHVVQDSHGNPVTVRSKLEIDVAKILNDVIVSRVSGMQKKKSHLYKDRDILQYTGVLCFFVLR